MSGAAAKALRVALTGAALMTFGPAAAGGVRRAGNMRVRPAVPGIRRDLRHGYRQERDKQRDDPLHTFPARSVVLLLTDISAFVADR